MSHYPYPTAQVSAGQSHYDATRAMKTYIIPPLPILYPSTTVSSQLPHETTSLGFKPSSACTPSSRDNYRLRVPQHGDLSPHPRQSPIAFSASAFGGAQRVAFYDRDYVLMDGKEDPVLRDEIFRKFAVCLYWPVYERVKSSVLIQAPLRTSRKEVARYVSRCIADLYHELEKIPAQPGYEAWTVGKRGIPFQKIWITSVTCNYLGEWIPELEVEV
ncbi:hypothetical protein JAAARDRAFT_46449 [Jaapia argillacea MUCL 33604]|uniref:Uncharacterized protein n=1 Tax=Jaapia argillacea MUCL 33604 TaxID=933084 RepID=A0A067PYF4_9AGAM|nr:hypothetical protein JAAARDRAFT_46449 [Jaapia argillacea MUCL 33604]